MAPPSERSSKARRAAPAQRNAGAAPVNLAGAGHGSTPPSEPGERARIAPPASAPALAATAGVPDAPRAAPAGPESAPPPKPEPQALSKPQPAPALGTGPHVPAQHVPFEPRPLDLTPTPATAVAPKPSDRLLASSASSGPPAALSPPLPRPPRAPDAPTAPAPRRAPEAPASPPDHGRGLAKEPASAASRAAEAPLSPAMAWRDEVLDLLREEVEQGLAASRALAQCRSPQAALAVQADYLGRAFARGSERGQRLMRLWVATASHGGALRGL